jgi:phage tail-like protein
MGTTVSRPSQYLDHLPQLFRKLTPVGMPNFLGEYLKIFEALLAGRDDARDQNNKQIAEGIEELISGFTACLDAGLTPVADTAAATYTSDFLNYLASWVALVFDQNWPLEKKRAWLQKIVALYRKRGTRSGLTEYLHMFIGQRVRVEELARQFVVGNPDNSLVGVNTYIAGAAAYYFQVRFNYGFPPETFVLSEWNNYAKGIRTIVDLEKPAHTYYDLDTRTPGIIVGGVAHPQNAARSTVGKDTLIWNNSTKLL